MNKKLITLAVAGAMVAPLAAAADTTIYGSIRVSANYADGDRIEINDDGAGGVDFDPVSADAEWDVQNDVSRVGIKGSEDLGNGLKAIFQAEWGLDAGDSGELSGRLAYAGLTGGFGTAAIGRQWTPYYFAINKTSIFNANSFDPYYIGTGRTGKAVAYKTPNFGGFVGTAAMVMVANGGDNVDAYNLTAEYNNGPISLGLGYHKAASGAIVTIDPAGAEDETGGWGIAGSYNFGMFKVAAQYEDWDQGIDLDGDGKADDWSEWSIAGEAYFGNHTVRAMYGSLDYDADDTDSWGLGYQYSFSKRTRVYAEYGDLSGVNKSDPEGDYADVGDGTKFALGIRHDF